MTDELRVKRQAKCAEHGHQFDKGTYGICIHCQLTVTRREPIKLVPPLKRSKGRRRGRL